MLEFAATAKQGILPAAGGLIDQTACFVEAWAMIRGEDARHHRQYLDALKKRPQ